MEQTTRVPRREESLAKTRTLTKMALCVALLAISAYISFPLPFTPAMVTALTIVVNLTAFILKPKEAFLAVLAWMILGAVGVPVFVGGTAGLGKLVGPTGGFVVSFVVAAWLMSKLRGNATSFKTLACLGILSACRSSTSAAASPCTSSPISASGLPSWQRSSLSCSEMW